MPAQSAASAVDDDGDVYYDGTVDAGAYYTAKLRFFHNLPVKVWVAYYTSVHIIYYDYYLLTNIVPAQYLVQVHVSRSQEQSKHNYTHSRVVHLRLKGILVRSTKNAKQSKQTIYQATERGSMSKITL